MVALSCAIALLSARAEDSPPVLSEPEATQQLYREALLSIAEGRKDDASAALARVILREPEHAGAWLDLALIQCELGHADEAERMFAVIETRFSPPNGIIQLINAARDGGCHDWHPTSQLSVTVGRGIDQNVNQGASSAVYTATELGVPVVRTVTSDFYPKHDQYTLASIDYVRDLSPNGTLGFVQLQDRRNDHLGQYNSTSLFAGVETPWRLGRWTLYSTGLLGLISLGDRPYQYQQQLQMRMGPPLPLPATLQFNLIGSLTHVKYLTLDNFDSNSVETRGQFSYKNDSTYATASTGYLRDHATGERPGGDRHGTLSTLLWRRQLSPQWLGELSYSRQTWFSSSAYSQGLIDQIRSQQTQAWRASISYPLNKHTRLQLEVRQIRDKENISIFQYNERQLQLSWQWQGL